ncbi:MAG: S8 family serine peptidase [Pirellulales bacterium]|nr:S8 family serine peptidase [Pirellulales bacterium]
MRPSNGPRALRISRVESMEPRLLLSVNSSLGELSAYTTIEARADLDLDTFWIAQDALDGLDRVHNEFGLTGAGQTVAVIDTGIAYNHTALGGGYGANYRVVGGYDFAEGDADPNDDGARGSHGTHVAGILGSTDPVYGGIAPGVDLVALRVFDDQGRGSFDWVEQALEWVHVHRNDFENPITTVNLSIGVNFNGDDAVPDWAMLEDELAVMAADGIFVAVAAGNRFTSYNTPGLAYPAVSQYVVPVASVDPDGELSYYSQRHERAIAAPGRGIQSTVPDSRGNGNGLDDDFAKYSGTSMAAPFVAAASVLLRQAYELVGVHNVTQAALVELMHQTADTIYDPITRQEYDRLNLGRAIDAVMPADDYGSTLLEAHAWGTVGQLATLNGAVERVGDQDWFRFTAKADGTASFTVDTTQGLSAGWQVGSGIKAQGIGGTRLTIEVVAGQSYIIGISGQAGVGRYTIESDFEPAARVIDWGQVVQDTFLNTAITSAGTWFSATATNTGLLTIEALRGNKAAGNVRFQLYDANQRLLADSGTSGRVDVNISAGTQVFLRATTTGNPTVDFRVTNLITQTGSSVVVRGTAGNDTFEFTAGKTLQIVVGGVHYAFSNSQVGRVHFEGGAGNDQIKLTGAAGNDSADVRLGRTEMHGSGYAVTAVGVENISLQGSAGTDTLVLHDTAGKDTLTIGPTRSTLVGAGLNVQADGFEQVRALSQAGGNDTVRFTDSAGDDTFVVTTAYAKLQGAGFYLRAEGFRSVEAIATAGRDTAYVRDTRGDDLFVATPTWAEMRGSGYLFRAENFDTVLGYALDGGRDTARLLDSAGNDQLLVAAGSAQLQGQGFDIRARYFEQLDVAASTGGYDTAKLLLSKSTDRLQASATLARLLSDVTTAELSGFDRVLAYAASGARPTIQRKALDYVLELTGQWTT